MMHNRRELDIRGVADEKAAREVCSCIRQDNERFLSTSMCLGGASFRRMDLASRLEEDCFGVVLRTTNTWDSACFELVRAPVDGLFVLMARSLNVVHVSMFRQEDDSKRHVGQQWMRDGPVGLI